AGRFQILLMGDLNGRTNSRTGSANDPLRKSMDDKPTSTRGRFLLKLCADYDLVILNGDKHFVPNSGAFTWFQGEHRTVIDYAICSRSLYPNVSAFNVIPLESGFDHAALAVQLEV
ncbi:hypothetical protein B0H14DRAFT_2313108, partial [Mycena olivaceomarginata]